MNAVKKISAITTLAASVLLAPTAALGTNVDSFFDIFYEVSFDDSTQRPMVSATAMLFTRDTGPRSVPIEILSMDLTSISPQPGTMHHNVLVVSNIGSSGEDGVTDTGSQGQGKGQSSNIGSSGEDGVPAYAELDIECETGDPTSAGNADTTCTIQSAKSISHRAYRHRGHVTVLK